MPKRELLPHEQDQLDRISKLTYEAGKLVDELGGDLDNDKRFIAIGWTNLQTGFMFLNRAVEKPGT